MGIFIKSPEEKKLKELTGNFLINNRFEKILESAGLSINDGYKIQSILKEEIKNGKLKKDDIEDRLNFLIDQISPIKSKQIIRNKVKVSSPKERKLRFLINQNHNIIKCPECRSKNIKYAKYCYKCGFNFTTKTKRKPEDKKIKVKKHPKKQKTKQKPIKNMNNNYNLKYAYIHYLYHIYKNNSIIDEEQLKQYNIKLTSLNQKAIMDNYIISSNINLNNLTVEQLKDILRDNNQKVSGKKQELIKRISLNVPIHDLIQYFEINITDNAINYINNNKYVITYFRYSELKHIIDMNTYEELFTSKNKNDENTIQKIILDYLTNQEAKIVAKQDITNIKRMNYIMAHLYQINNNISSTISNYLKIFIIELNNFSEITNKAEPQYCNLNPILTDNISKLIKKHSITRDLINKLFNNSYNSLKTLNLVISNKDSFNYLTRLLNGEDANKIANEIQLTYIKTC